MRPFTSISLISPLPARGQLVRPQFAFDKTGDVGSPVRQKTGDPGRDIQGREPMDHVAGETLLRNALIQQCLRCDRTGCQQHFGPMLQCLQYRQDGDRFSNTCGMHPEQWAVGSRCHINAAAFRQSRGDFAAVRGPTAQVQAKCRRKDRCSDRPAGGHEAGSYFRHKRSARSAAWFSASVIIGTVSFQPSRDTLMAGPQTMMPWLNGSGTAILSQVSSWMLRPVRAAQGSTGTPASAAS